MSSEQGAGPVTRSLFQRRKWVLVGSGLLLAALCLAFAVTARLLQRPRGDDTRPPVETAEEPGEKEPHEHRPQPEVADASAPGDKGATEDEPTEYESQAIIEVVASRPLGAPDAQPPDIAQVLTQIQIELLTWTNIREIILSRKVDFGEETDPDDRDTLERIYDDVLERTRIRALSHTHIAVSHRSSSPQRNAALVNQMVMKFIGEDRRRQQERARADLKYCRDKLAVAKTALEEVDNQVREFNQQYPWLTDKLAEIQKDYEAAEAEELRIRQEIRAAEETLSELRKQLSREKPEVVEIVPGQISREVVELRAAVERAMKHFEQMDKLYTQAHTRWQEACASLRMAMAELREVGTGPPEDLRIVKPNPIYVGLRDRIAQLEKELEKLCARKLDANKRVSELYIRRRKAPELMAERRALDEARSMMASTAAEYAHAIRTAVAEMERLVSEAHGSRFRVVEFARYDRRPVSPDPSVGLPPDGEQDTFEGPQKLKPSRPGPDGPEF
ncbi:MAG TPA: hypothetical protein VNE39_18655 [Planctomycetota bacterium]|nr:hypothetical protein [Planctomycetota bacterium]